MRVKICGITNVKDALTAAELGTDAVGFVFYSTSPRFVPAKEVAKIVRRLPPFVTTVGVFADAEEEQIRAIVEETGIEQIQLQGDEPPEFCGRLGYRVIKAIRVKDAASLERMASYSVRSFVLDTYRKDQPGGTGKTFDWKLALEAKKFGSIILAGGLTPENVARAIETVKPDGVDVSSGVEERVGKKDPRKMRRFIEASREAFRRVVPEAVG